MTRSGRRGAASLAFAALACAGPVAVPVTPAPVAGAFGRVEVRLADESIEDRLGPGDARRLRAIVRQSARDWLEQAGRLAEPAPLALEVTLESLRLRPAAVAWLFGRAAAPDHLAARVRVLRDGVEVSAAVVRVESALAGYSWRDPGPRLERLARRLGRRIALRL